MTPDDFNSLVRQRLGELTDGVRDATRAMSEEISRVREEIHGLSSMVTDVKKAILDNAAEHTKEQAAINNNVDRRLRALEEAETKGFLIVAVIAFVVSVFGRDIVEWLSK